MSTINKVIGARIKQKRRELGITQDQLGQILGCTQQMIQNYEVGFCAIPISMLSDLALLCRLPVDWFFLVDNEMLVYLIEL